LEECYCTVCSYYGYLNAICNEHARAYLRAFFLFQ
jgi:hypothetical protein